jgi:hypothetical protein
MKPWPVQGFLLDILRHFKNMDGQFKIRTYGYGELALLYFPNSTKKSASVQLRRWIISDNNLKTDLENSGFKKWQKLLTPKQVGIIINYIGEPC